MSRFRKLSQTIWHCQYHIVWVPKYRYRILNGEIAREVENLIRAFSHQMKYEIIELNVQIDHVYLLVMIPPKISWSKAEPTLANFRLYGSDQRKNGDTDTLPINIMCIIAKCPVYRALLRDCVYKILFMEIDVKYPKVASAYDRN